jgi:predicted transcriptional regulator
MSDFSTLSRRERQIMEILYAADGATVAQVAAGLDGEPTDGAVRRLLQILEEKGHVRRRKSGREFVYSPTESRKRAGERALKRLLETFFDGALDKAFAVHLGSKDSRITEEELARLSDLIDEARRQGR